MYLTLSTTHGSPYLLRRVDEEWAVEGVKEEQEEGCEGELCLGYKMKFEKNKFNKKNLFF